MCLKTAIGHISGIILKSHLKRVNLSVAGVGRALAKEFLRAGDSVVICSRDSMLNACSLLCDGDMLVLCQVSD